MIKYTITPCCYAHAYSVDLSFIASADTHDLKLPTWIPGSYMVREFSKNISHVRLFTNQTLPNLSNASLIDDGSCIQVNKNTWQLSGLIPNKEYIITYVVYAYDFSIRAAYLDDTRGYFNNTSLCMYISGMEDYEHVIALQNLPESWQVATQLPKLNAKSHEYLATNYFRLIDSPFELGYLTILHFEIKLRESVPIHHRIVLSGVISRNFAAERLIQDISAICTAIHQQIGRAHV